MTNKLFKAIFISCMMSYAVLSCEQTKAITSSESMNSPITNIKAEKSYKKIDSLKGYFFNSPEEFERYNNSTFLDKKIFEDKVIKNRKLLAQNFLDSFPYDKHYYDVLKFYFNMNFEPIFIEEEISDSLKAFLTKNMQFGTPEAYRRYRSLPIDMEAKRAWLNEGYALSNTFLNTDAARKDKLTIENALLAREMRQTFKLNFGMEGRLNEWQAGYWSEVDQLLWESFRIRMNGLIEKYADMEIIATNVSGFINFVSFKSPHLTLPYWKKFLEFTISHPQLANSKGFKAIQDLAKQNIAALKKVDLIKPLNCSFKSIDGKYINLKDLRGKVVLIDFWSVRCPPCISEMPFMQALYEKYKSKGFEIIGLAAEGEESKNRVLEILKKQGATWPQHLDKANDAVVSYHALFNINGYPTVWLLNQDGLVVDKDARGERLEPLIRKYLELDNE